MIRRFCAPAVLLTIASTALVSNADAACAFGDESPVTWVIHGLDRTPVQGDATVTYSVVPLGTPDDTCDGDAECDASCDPVTDADCETLCDPAVDPDCDDACNPAVDPDCDDACDPAVDPDCDDACDPAVDPDCDDACDPAVDPDCDDACDPAVDPDCDDACDPAVDPDCDDACDPAVDPDCDDACDPAVDPDCAPNTDVEPSGTLTVDMGASTVAPLASGMASLTISADGFESKELVRSICGPSRVRVTLLPDRLVTLRMSVVALRDGESVDGTMVVLQGLDERAGLRHEATVGADGTVDVVDVKAGFYAVSLRRLNNGVTQHVELPMVDILHDSKMAVRLRSSDDLPDTRVTCASSLGGSGGWSALLVGLALFGLRRRPTS